MTAAIGTLAQLGIDSTNPVTKQFDFVSENIITQSQPIDSSGVRGTRQRFIDRVRPNLQHVGGALVMQPNAVELSNLLPWILGGTPSGSGTVTYPLADTVPQRYITVDRIAKVFTYSGVAVDVATFAAEQGNPMSLELQCVGQTETIANAGTFPGGLSINTANGPLILSDLALSINSTTVTCRNFRLTISNHINRDRFFNNLTLQSTDAWDRNVQFSTVIPYGDWTTLYTLGGATAGVNVTGTFTYGGAVLTFTMPKVVFAQHTPSVPGRQEEMLPMDGIAYSVGGGSPTTEVSCTLNVGP